MIVELADLLAGRGGRVLDGPDLDGPSVSRLFCDSALHRVVMAGRSAVLDYGTATRTIPTPLWNALVIRDEHCRFPGGDRPSTWCEGHHVVWVTRNGTTELANLVLVCPSPPPPPPPSPPPARLARQAPPGRHLRGHRSQ